MRTLEQAGDLKGKKVFLRAEMNVPVGENSIIADEFRLARARDTITSLLGAGAHVLIGAHITDLDSFQPLIPQLQRIFHAQLDFCRDFDEAQRFLTGPGSLALLENLRTNSGEEDNNEAFAGQLVAGCDLYVNDAFGVCHREHASVATAPLIVPSYAGPVIVDEVKHLEAALDAPAEGKVVFIGGAKAETKLPVITHMLERAEVIAVGGKLANELGTASDPRVRLPVDFIVDDGLALDIGPQAAAAFAELARTAKFIVWNGPMGKFEDPRYAKGTEALARAVSESKAEKVIGGGDTVAAVDKLGLLDTMGFVSTGGGAMLAFLAGQVLPGLKALGYYDAKA